jgi:hypothetical protein
LIPSRGFKAFQRVPAMAMKSQWFWRCWTLQEIAVAKKAIVVCGQRQLPWDMLSGVDVMDDWADYSSAWYDALRERKHIRKTLLAHRNYISDGRSSVDDYYEDTVMQFFFHSHLEATDPRDLIYGLRAIYQNLRLKMLAPDYTKSISQVFEDMTIAAIQHTRSLNVICGKLASKESDDFDLPSWVFNWKEKARHENKFILLLMDYDYYAPALESASKKTRYYLSTNHQERYLLVRGRVLGVVIKRISPSYSGLFTSDTPGSLLKKCIEPHVIAEGRADEEAISWVKGSLAEIFFFFLRSRTKGSASVVEEYWRYFWISENSSLGYSYRDETIRDRINKLTKGEISDTSPLENAVALLLDTPYLGLAVRAEVGDKVVIAEGSSYPLVLRPKGGFYELISVAYIPGVMEGEAWPYSEDQPGFRINKDEKSEQNLSFPEGLQSFVLV